MCACVAVFTLILKEAKVKEINDIREKEKIAVQLKETNYQQLLEQQSNKKEKLSNLQTKVNRTVYVGTWESLKIKNV